MTKFRLLKDVYLNEEVVPAGSVVEMEEGDVSQGYLDRKSMVLASDDAPVRPSSAFERAVEQNINGPIEEANAAQAKAEAEAREQIAATQEKLNPTPEVAEGEETQDAPTDEQIAADVQNLQ